MSKAKLGSGERFKSLAHKLANQPGVTDPKALAAHIGMMKYGKHKMSQMAQAGKKKNG